MCPRVQTKISEFAAPESSSTEEDYDACSELIIQLIQGRGRASPRMQPISGTPGGSNPESSSTEVDYDACSELVIQLIQGRGRAIQRNPSISGAPGGSNPEGLRSSTRKVVVKEKNVVINALNASPGKQSVVSNSVFLPLDNPNFEKPNQSNSETLRIRDDLEKV